MAHTDHKRPQRKSSKRSDDVTRVRQPRPALRRTGTRHGAILAATREG